MPCPVSRSINSSGAERTVAALVPRGSFMGTETATVRSERMVRWGSSGTRCLLSWRVKRKNVANGPVHRRRHIHRLPQFDYGAAEPVQFEAISVIQVGVHRGIHLERQGVAERQPSVGKVFGKVDTVGPAYGHHFAHDGQKKCA